MKPLTRQRTLESLRSWWSNSNPNLRGPTINLHAAAMPLMKLLYNRQASDFIRNNRDILLSEMDWEIYKSYLSCQYISKSTKGTILWDIRRRAYSEHEALAVHAHMFHDFVPFLEVSFTWITVRAATLENLAMRESAAAVTCGSLVAVVWYDITSVFDATPLIFAVSDSDTLQAVEGALWVLSRVPHLKFPSVTSGVSVEEKLLDRLLDMLKDSSTAGSYHWWILKIISNLACHESTGVAVMGANTLNSVEEFLRESRPAHLYGHIFRILHGLASGESWARALHPFDLRPIPWGIYINAYLAPHLTLKLIATLTRIAGYPDGAEGIVKSNLLNPVLDGLHSVTYSIRLSTCKLLRALVRHRSVVRDVLAVVPREHIFTLSRNRDDDVRDCAVETLEMIDSSLEELDGKTLEVQPPGIMIVFGRHLVQFCKDDHPYSTTCFSSVNSVFSLWTMRV
ncbi:hypothetical protein C8J57DRAFT_1473691 [Mycena rebaudengoi]|nr:hypothetical protein C8J57DRAFT_1473691 [Mycena rebaudengoi]